MVKVIFLHLSVIHSVHRGGGGLPQCMLGYHPPGSSPPPPDQADTPPGPGSRHPSDQADTILVFSEVCVSHFVGGGMHAGGTATEVGGTHPTGMHSCFC